MLRLVGPVAVLSALVACTSARAGGTSGADSNRRAPEASQLRPGKLPARDTSVPAASAEAETSEQNQDELEASCSSAKDASPHVLTESGGPKRYYSLDGYLARFLRIERNIDQGHRAHCVLVAWPAGKENRDGQPVRVAADIHDGWLRGLHNTLLRLPWHHLKIVNRLIIDNRPTEHGIAAFDRQSADDTRDGRSIWLHEHLFRDRNHWGRGNYGAYWSYHVNQDGRTFHTSSADHELFSPVLLHEIGHLVMYQLVNRPAVGIEATSAPGCARTCGDADGCRALPPVERERGCVSPYCMPFRFKTSTENWAEQYRFYYQSSFTRALLSEAAAGCVNVLAEHNRNSAPPWQSGLPDMANFRRSIWISCGSKACKPW